MNLVIDIGNTQTKWGIFKGDVLHQHLVSSSALDIPKEILKHKKFNDAIISNVRDEHIGNIFSLAHQTFQLNELKNWSFPHKYQTPETLGQDRIANLACAHHYFKGENVLIIDMGTCITTSFLHKSEGFIGGSISPGIQMRLKAMNVFTGQLPLLKFKTFEEWLPGNTTELAILTGTFFAISDEIDGLILRYIQAYGKIKTIITGGNVQYFEKHLKSSIFADPFFTLKGLNVLLLQQIGS